MTAAAGGSQVVARVDHGVRKGGNVSIIGVYGPPWNLVDIGAAMNKGLTLRMNQCNVRRYMAHLLKHISIADGSCVFSEAK